MYDNDTFTPSRRRFLERILTAAVVSSLAPATLLGRITPTLRRADGALVGRYGIDLTQSRYAALASVNGSVRLTGIPGVGFAVILTRISETEFAAVNAVCTHEGCTVERARPTTGNNIECSCHGSRFTPTGEVVQGPAELPLERYDTFFDGGTRVEIDIPGAIASIDAETASGMFVSQATVDRAAGTASLTIVLEHATHVRASVHATDGRQVVAVHDGALAAGEHAVRATIEGLAAGAYLFRVETGDRSVMARRFVVSR